MLYADTALMAWALAGGDLRDGPGGEQRRHAGRGQGAVHRAGGVQLFLPGLDPDGRCAERQRRAVLRHAPALPRGDERLVREPRSSTFRTLACCAKHSEAATASSDSCTPTSFAICAWQQLHAAVRAGPGDVRHRDGFGSGCADKLAVPAGAQESSCAPAALAHSPIEERAAVACVPRCY